MRQNDKTFEITFVNVRKETLIQTTEGDFNALK